MNTAFGLMQRYGILLLGVSMLAAGCGGGGGSGSSGSSQSPVAITADNADDVTASVNDSVNAAAGVTEQGGDTLTSVTPAPASSPSLHAILQRQLQRLSQQQAVSGTAAVAGVSLEDQTIACSSGDIQLLVVEDSIPGLSSGDRLSFIFNNCFDNELDAILDGTLVMSNLAGALNLSGSFSVSASFTFNDLTMIDGTETARFNGGLSYNISSNDGIEITTTMDGNSLSLVENDVSSALRDFAFDLTINSNTTEFTLEAQGTLEDDGLNGRVSFTTPQPLTGLSFFTGTPESGSLKMVGDSSAVTAVAQGGGSLRLDIDSDGDGSVDDTRSVTWSELEPLS